ncbi:MAG: sugar transferase, partial [Planctomycetales bacterium]|nr:sugar transferase [Planctomycetales bacterium]
MVSTAFLHPTAQPAPQSPVIGLEDRVQLTDVATTTSLAYSRQNVASAAPLALGDMLSVAGASIVAYGVLSLTATPPSISPIFLTLSSSLAVVLAFFLLELYPACGVPPVVEFRQAITGVALVATGCLFASLSLHTATTSTLACFAIWGFISAILVPLTRSTVRALCSRFEWWRQPVLVVGSADFCRHVENSLCNDRRSGLRTVAVVVNETDRSNFKRYRGDEIAGLAKRHGAYRAILSSLSLPVGEVANSGLPIPHLHLLNHGAAAPMLWGRTTERNGWPELECQNRLLVPSSAYCKRAMDVIITMLALPALLPLFIILVAAVRVSSPGPAFYSQRRLGRNGEQFAAWKFRTMVVNADEALKQHLAENPELRDEWERDHKLKRDPRVTAIGRFLRKTSLDELPQLWNVLQGDMSLVGPRPIVNDEIEKYGPVFDAYKRVRPGITGLWQISGRNNTT